MSRGTRPRSSTAALDAMDRNLDGLSRELTCLIELGALSEEETGALCACLEDLRQLLACSRVPDAPGPSARTQTAVDLTELSGRTGFLAADIDLAYQRLGVAA